MFFSIFAAATAALPSRRAVSKPLAFRRAVRRTTSKALDHAATWCAANLDRVCLPLFVACFAVIYFYFLSMPPQDSDSGSECRRVLAAHAAAQVAAAAATAG